MGHRQRNRLRTAAGIVALITIGAATGACSSDGDSAKKYAEEQAKKAQAEKRGTMEVETIDVPIRGGVRIECPDLFTDVAAFSAGIAAGSTIADDTVHMTQLDARQQIKRQPGVNAICEFIRDGERPSAEEQKKMSEKTERLGVLPDDPYCEIRVDCGRPAQDDYESKCRGMPQHEANRSLGIFACVLKSQRAERDAFRFKFFEPDTGCFLDVLGGPSVTGEEIPLACAKAAMDQIKAESIAKYKTAAPPAP
jgi:hypothetical protein